MASSHLLLFLPFARMALPVQIGGIEFVPLTLGDGSTPSVLADGKDAISTILGSYRDRHGSPLTNCTVATVPGRGWDLAESDFAAVQWASTLLFLAAWSSNEYLPKFGGHYVNATAFRLVGQKFSGDSPHWIALRSRRRDGGKWDGGYQHGQALFSLPLQCDNDTIAIDGPLLAALDLAHQKSADTVGRLRTALPFVTLANTDDDLIDEIAEAILMGSAFEQLLGGGQFAYKLGRLFGTLFGKCGSVSVKTALATRPQIRIDSDPQRAIAQSQWWVHRKWIEELHRLRSQAVHEGHVQGGSDFAWSAHEHLLMAAHTFPLAVKILLERDGHYTFTAHDRARCRAIDIILAAQGWDADADGSSLWHYTIREIESSQQWEEVWRQVQQKYPELLGETNTAAP